MDEFVAKPVRTDALWSAIERLMAPAVTAPSDAPSGIDPSLLLAACGDDDTLLERLCQVLREQLPRDLLRTQEAMLARDLAEVREAAHRLAGTVAAVSTEAGVTAFALEDEAARGQSVEVSRLFERLARQTHDVLQALGGVSVARLRAQADTARLTAVPRQ
jgi:HPt (histidine-containing phosphotransfer) domain-containing protein